MTSIARRAGSKLAELIERSGDPGAILNRVQIYGKDDTGVTQLFAQDSAGTAYQLTPPAGGGSLDDAYNGGRTITVDAGPAILDADSSDTTAALEITREPGAPGASKGIQITVGANAFGAAIQIDASGAGDGIRITKTAAGASGQGIDITMGASSTSQGIIVNQQAAQTGIRVNQTGAGSAYDALVSGGGTAFVCTITAATGRCANFGSTGTSTQPLINLNMSPSASGGGRGISGTHGANTTADFFTCINQGSGNCIDIEQDGGGDAINVELGGAVTTQQALVAATVVATTNPMVALSHTNAAASVADMININKSPSAGSLAGSGIDVTMGANTTGDGIVSTMSGSGNALTLVGPWQTDQGVALGGGAAPTFGTIGGSGPAAAAQNEWIAITTAGGARFIAAWA